MSICAVLTCGTRATGATARAGVAVGGIEKNHVARMPAPEMTAVDFQSMLEKNTAILTFRFCRPRPTVGAGNHPSLFSVLRSWALSGSVRNRRGYRTPNP